PAGPAEPTARTTPKRCAPGGQQAAVQPVGHEKDRPFARVLPAAKAPVIDGQIDPDEWGHVALSGFYDEYSRTPVPESAQTSVWLRYDESNLYIAAKLMEPHVGNLTAYVRQRDGDVWNDDCFEVFLDPRDRHDAAEYYHLLVNPAGVVCDLRGAAEVGQGLAWDCSGLRVKASRARQYWAVEMAIPFKSLGVSGPLAGQHWAANFCRERKPGNAENSTWVDLGTDWEHQPELFGHIAFQP
ncbi:MAG: carbohydrate-binding family 9-like protein, partial [Phycisphaerae bacterium]